MGGTSKPFESLKTAEQPTEKKKGIADWMNKIKPGNEEKDHWVMLECSKFFALFYLDPSSNLNFGRSWLIDDSKITQHNTYKELHEVVSLIVLIFF